MKKTIILVAIILMVAGCLSPIKKLGCCLKEHIEEGCKLYNTTTFETKEMFAETVPGSCDNPDMGTEGHCNVSIGEKYYLIPICSQDDLVPCIDPNCTAMVCGDFAYKPTVAPGIATEGETAEEVGEDAAEQGTPANLEEEAAIRLYKAQCRFLPMDADLRTIMQSSKSQLNVFRMGVGGSFDEYDQYRFYFPMSDQFCAMNPQGFVDRYMNYIDPSTDEPYNPLDDEEGITENCFDDDDPPACISYPEESMVEFDLGSFLGEVSVDAVLPDENNYKFRQYAVRNVPIVFEAPLFTDEISYIYDEDNVWTSFHKEIDKGYYKRQLSIAYGGDIYEGESESGRAPFECELGQGQCFSGTCSTQDYTRSTMVNLDGDDVITDCFTANDQYGINRVFCPPLIDIDTSDPDDPPDRTYGKVKVMPVYMSYNAKPPGDYQFPEDEDYNGVSTYMNWEGKGGDYGKIMEFASGDDKLLQVWWSIWNENSERFDRWIGTLGIRDVTNTVEVDFGTSLVKKHECDDYYNVPESADDADDKVLCPTMTESSSGPPAGGALFFGEIDGDTIQYGDEIIIGYALASSESEFKSWMLYEGCDMTEDDYRMVDVKDRDNWEGLTGVFEPYFMQRFNAMMQLGGWDDDGCGDDIDTHDIIMSNIPWVISYQKGHRASSDLLRWRKDGDERKGGHIQYFHTSPISYAIAARNTYDEAMTPLGVDTTSCEMRKVETSEKYEEGDYNRQMRFGAAASRYIFLITYDDDGTMGSCEVDKKTMKPVVRTFGWCEPCTSSTLAYQTIDAMETPYMPTTYMDSQNPLFISDICNSTYVWDFSTGYQENISCFHPYITDMSDYGGEALAIKGTPRTEPNAAIMKLRLGNYLKSGVMPVLDLSYDSNWEKENINVTTNTCWEVCEGEGDEEICWEECLTTLVNYTQYDFEALIGRMGTAVIIVETVYNEDDAIDKGPEIVERASQVRGRCFGCLTAFHVEDQDSVEDFNDTIKAVLLPSVMNLIDMVTFDYDVSEHEDVSADGAEAVVDDMISYGHTALHTKNKPSMVVDFSVASNDEYWNEDNYEELFSAIVMKQGEMIKSGIVGVIYTPARGSSSGTSLVEALSSTDVGEKKPKFCSMQGALERMAATAPTTIFTKSTAVEEVMCSPCTTTDLFPGGECTMSDPLTCDDGVGCTMPDILEPDTQYKCPSGVVTADCPICSEMGGTFECTRVWANGSIDEGKPNGDMGEITSDIYQDILGGFPKPEKCCLYDEASGSKYTYVKNSYQIPINLPIVFPKAGHMDVDCSVGTSPSELGKVGSFCGLQESPIKDYDIECSHG